jgi:hypothetical protein
LKAAEEGIDHLKTVWLKLMCLVVVHVGEHHFACLINYEEESGKGLVVLAECLGAADRLQLSHTLFLHQETYVLSAQPIAALFLQRSAFRLGLQ